MSYASAEYNMVNVTVTDTLTDHSETIRTSDLQSFLAETHEHYTSQGYELAIGGIQLNSLSHPIPSILDACIEGTLP